MNKIYKLIAGTVALTSISFTSKAQLAGTFSVPATYSTIAAAITDLNTQGVNGPVTILINAAYTETAPVGGYTLTATGTLANPIVFQKNGIGANPLITAYGGGTGTPSMAFQDGIWRFIGSDYITVDGIDLIDPNAANPATMEFGYGLFRASATDGCQNNTIKNCVITLNRINNDFGSSPASDGSRGIDVVNAMSGAHTTPLTISAASGANSNNKFYTNTIQNCNIGIAIIGYSDFSPFTFADNGNDVGGSLLADGNSFINYGGAVPATYPADAVRTMAQYSLNVSNNTVNSNNGGGVNHPNTLRGFYINNATSANVTISNNTITLSGGGTTSQLLPIYNLSGSTAASNTINISNNLITNCTYTSASSGAFYGIYNSGGPAVLSVNSNTFLNNSTNASSGQYYNIYNTGFVTSAINYSNNLINLGTFSATSTSALLAGLYNTGGSTTTTLSVSGNTLQNAIHTGTGTSSCYMLLNTSTQGLTNMSNNIWNNITLRMLGTVYFMYNSAYNNNILNNSVVGSFNRPFIGGTNYGYYGFGGSTGLSTVSGNNFSNFTMAGTSMYGIYHSASSLQQVAVTNNTISNITSGGTNFIYGMYVNYPRDISNNIVSNISNGGALYGMYFATGTSSYAATSNTIAALSTTANATMYGLYSGVSNTVSITKNKIYDLSLNNTSGFGSLYGIYLGAGTSCSLTNNTVGDLKMPFANNTIPLAGIYVAGGSNHHLLYNTVYLNATSSGFSFGSTALYASTTPNLNLRNNIFINLSTPNGGQYSSAYRRTSTSLTSYSATSNNNIFYAGTPGANNLIFYDGFNSMQTISSFTFFVSPRDAASQTENSPFLSVVGTSPTFLHINPAAPSVAESGAINIAGITDDFDANIRQGNVGYVGTGTAPDIGADEFEANVVNCNAVVGGTVTPASVNKCIGQNVTLNASGYSAGTGITYQWQVSNTPGGPYSNVVGGSDPTYAQAYTSPTLGINTYYYVLLTTCSISGFTTTSVESTVSVLGYPVVVVTPSVGTICVPGGGSVTLTGSGANTYTWLPAAGLSQTVGVSVNAYPAATTVYTITGANLGGCSSTVTAMVTIAEFPNMTSISASPTLVCGGGSSSLTALGVTTSSYAITTITFAAIPTPTSGVTTLANAGVAVTPLASGNLDDGGWINLPMPFAFNFFGNTYSSFAVSTNGFAFLGSGLPNTFTGYGSTMPNAFKARPCIGSVYADLDFMSLGTIETFTSGVAPYRQVIINWSNGKFWPNTGSVTAQAIIYETTNVIESHIFQSTANQTAVEGIQNAAGNTAFVVAGRNSLSWPVVTPDAYRWTPAGGPLSYSWTPATYLNNTSIQNPVANTVTSSITYTATGTTPQGCSASTVISIVAEPNPTVTITGTNAVCSTSMVSLTASGAVNYTWSTGALTNTMVDTPTASVTYSAIGTTSNGCAGTATHSVTMNITPTVSIVGSSTVCSGSFINLSVNGANTYSWSNGSTLTVIVPAPTVNTTYSVLGTNAVGGCTNTAFKSVTLVALPTVTITPSPSGTICIGETAQLIASAGGADTYSWTTGATSAVAPVSPTISSTYTVYVGSNFTGCSNTGTISIIVDPCVGLPEISGGLNGISLYPNPNNGEFTIELYNGLNKKIEVSDLTGRIVLSSASEKDKMDINITNLAKGMYYVRIESDSKFEIFKIIKQ